MFHELWESCKTKQPLGQKINIIDLKNTEMAVFLKEQNLLINPLREALRVAFCFFSGNLWAVVVYKIGTC